MALRISGHLLLGVAKLYFSKSVFLGEEVTEALAQLSQGAESVEVVPSSGVATVRVKKSAAQVSSLQEMTEHTSLRPSTEVLPEVVANKEMITMGDHEYTPLALQLRAESRITDHIDASDTFLSDLNDTFRIDTIAPAEPMRTEQPTAPVMQTEPNVLMEAEEEVNALLDLDFTVRDEAPAPKKKRRHKQEPVRKEEEKEDEPEPPQPLVEEDEVVLPQASPEPENPPEVEPPPPEPEVEEPAPPDAPPAAEPEKKGFRKLKRAWVQDEESVLPDYEQVADLDSTSDIVRNPVFLSERCTKTAPEFEKLLFVPVIEGLTKELSDFFTSTHKILKLKNALRDAEAPEPPPAPEEPASPRPMKTQTPVAPPPQVVPMEMETETPIVKDEPPNEDPKPGEEEWSERTKRMLHLLSMRLKGVETLVYGDLSKGKDARTASAGFYELLVLVRRDYLDLEQTEGLGDLVIKPGRKMRPAA